MDAMLLALTIALAIAEVHAEMAVEHLAPSVVKANPPQWVTAVAIVAKTNALVALAIAKALVMAAVFLVLRDKLSFWLGSANALHFPTFQTLITMAKRLTWICLFLLCIAGVKAQTYCYHCYKYYDFQDIPYDATDKGIYVYFTFQDKLLYESEKNGSLYANSYVPGYKSYCSIYKLFEKKDGVLKYVEIDKNGNWQFDKRYWLVSEDREYLNLVYPYDQPQPDYIEVVKRFNLWFEKVTCYKKHSSVDNGAYEVPAMKY